MTDYITKSDVDTLLGAGWEGAGDAGLAVLQANTWLTAKGVALNDPVDARPVSAQYGRRIYF